MSDILDRLRAAERYGKGLPADRLTKILEDHVKAELGDLVELSPSAWQEYIVADVSNMDPEEAWDLLDAVRKVHGQVLLDFVREYYNAVVISPNAPASASDLELDIQEKN